MAKKSKAAAGKKKGVATKTDKTKKDKNVFKVAGSKIKKPRQVEVQLKKIKESIKDKHEKVDAKLKDLHEDMVVTKASSTKDVTKKGGGDSEGGVGSGSSNTKAKKSPANTKKVQKKLGKMQV